MCAVLYAVVITKKGGLLHLFANQQHSNLYQPCKVAD